MYIESFENQPEKSYIDRIVELEAIIDSAADAIISISAEGIINPVNPAGVSMLGEFFQPPVDITSRDIIEHCQPKYPDTGKPVLVNDISFARALRERFSNYEVTITIPETGEERVISTSGSPIYGPGGRVVGAVAICRDTTEQVKTRRNLELLNDIELNITAGLDFETLLKRTAEGIKRLVETDAAGIVLWDDEQRKITDVFFMGIPEYVAQALLLTPSVTKSIIESGKSGIVGNYPSHPSAVKEFVDIGLVNAVVVPVISKSIVYGAIHVLGLTPEKTFDESDVRILEAIAKPVAIAIENAQLYEAEHHIANTLQTSLLTMPHALPGVDFGYLYRSATEAAQVGGDFYDIFEIEHNDIGIIVGDVSGKGVEAATLTSLIKNTIRAYAYETNDPSSVIRKTNEAVIKSSPASTFATVFYGILNTNTGLLTYCSAGHPQAIIKRSESDIEILPTRSPIVGALPGLVYEKSTTMLNKNDILTVYTDGVIEARHNSGFFGEERLANFIKRFPITEPKELPQKIFDEVFHYAEGKLSDDVAILCVGLEMVRGPLS